jgi:long-chain acyl-CoA synthetase
MSSPENPLTRELAGIPTLAELLAWRVRRSPDAQAYRHYDAQLGAWASLSWQAFGERVERMRAALATLGLPHGARVALLLPNGLDQVTIDQAVLALGCAPVPMHVVDNPASLAYILQDSEAALLVVDTVSQWQAIAAVGPVPVSLRHVLVRQGAEALDGQGTPALLPLPAWLARTQGPAPNELPPGPAAEDLAALVYTSGTTGKPKGVMLTHRNILTNLTAVLQHIEPRSDDVFLSFLPLSHTFERTCGYYLPIAEGACIAFARSVAQLAEDLRTARPTILVSVPRIYERVYAKVQARLADAPAKHRLFELAVAVGWRRFCRAQGLPVEAGGSRVFDAFAWPLLARLVARPLLAQFGGRVRVAVSGGAALSQPIARAFLGLGLPVLQGYGMTESSPVVAANQPGDNDPATVGRPLAGVEVRIGDDRELLVRGPNVMRGYWKRPDDTARVLQGGWLHTGDQAAIDAHGRVRILGRLKEIIVTSTGEKIAPVDLELAIVADPLFEQAYCFGDDRPFIAAIVVLAREPWQQLARGLGVDPDAPASLTASAAVQAALARIHALTKDFPYYAQPRAVALTLQPWTVENGLITPTLKLKRASLVARMAPDMERLYQR